VNLSDQYFSWFVYVSAQTCKDSFAQCNQFGVFIEEQDFLVGDGRTGRLGGKNKNAIFLPPL